MPYDGRVLRGTRFANRALCGEYSYLGVLRDLCGKPPKPPSQSGLGNVRIIDFAGGQLIR